MRYKHQQRTVEFLHAHNGRAFIASDAGTGKTPTVLWWFSEAKVKGTAKRMLVLCPKSIVEPAWLADARKFVPHLRALAGIGPSKKKDEQALQPWVDIFITNHDSISHMSSKALLSFDTICIDESTAFKGNTSARTKQLHNYVKTGKWRNRIGMSGTPMPQSILDLWGQLYFVNPDDTPIFTSWRHDTTVPRLVRVGKQSIVTYEEKPRIRDAITAMYSSTIIRYAKEDCLDLPPQTMRTMMIQLSPALRKLYDQIAKEAVLELETGDVTAVHAGALAQKLLQVASGFAYGTDTEGKGHLAHKFSEERYELIGELVSERQHSLVAFTFKAQRDFLVKEMEARKIKYAVLDGDTKDKTPIVEAYQRGEYQTLLCNPQSVAHGLTLTKGDTIIWAGATANLEHFAQFNARIDRVGQTKHNEVIMIEADKTYEQSLYKKLLGKHVSQLDLLDMLKEK